MSNLDGLIDRLSTQDDTSQPENLKWFQRMLELTDEIGDDITVGGNPLLRNAQEKLGDFLDWLDVHYEVDIGTTALYWSLSYQLAQRIKIDET